MALTGTKGIRVLVADDHRMVRAGIRAMLSLSSTGMECEVTEADTTEAAVACVDADRYDVVLMDYRLPGRWGPKGTEMILQRHPDVCVLGMSSYDERGYVENMIEAGARGYILKNVEPDTLVTAIRTVMAGRPFYSMEIAVKWMDRRMVSGGPGFPGPGPLDRLSEREKDVFRLIMTGLRDWEIAESLFLSKRTINKHRQNLMRKLEVRNVAELVQMGMRLRVGE